MQGALFIASLVSVTIALAVFTRVPKYWWVVVFVVVALLECLFEGRPSPSWEVEHVAASWLLGNIIPWGAVALYVWLTPYPRRAWLVAGGLPIIYIAVLVAGLIYGDASGLIPQ